MKRKRRCNVYVNKENSDRPKKIEFSFIKRTKGIGPIRAKFIIFFINGNIAMNNS